jgi:hypothetical protein
VQFVYLNNNELNLFPTLEMVLYVHFAIVRNCNLLSIFGNFKLFIWINLKLYNWNIVGYISSVLFGDRHSSKSDERLCFCCAKVEKEKETGVWQRRSESLNAISIYCIQRYCYGI